MRSRSRRFAQVALTVACTGCGDAPPAGPAHATHPMVGQYDVEATFTSLRPDVRRPEVLPATATLRGIVVVGDTVEMRGAQVFFPDVRLDGAVFCATPGSCGPSASYRAFTTLFGPVLPVTFGFSGAGGEPTLHFEGPFVAGGFTGPRTTRSARSATTAASSRAGARRRSCRPGRRRAGAPVR